MVVFFGRVWTYMRNYDRIYVFIIVYHHLILFDLHLFCWNQKLLEVLHPWKAYVCLEPVAFCSRFFSFDIPSYSFVIRCCLFLSFLHFFLSKLSFFPELLHFLAFFGNLSILLQWWLRRFIAVAKEWCFCGICKKRRKVLDIIQCDGSLHDLVLLSGSGLPSSKNSMGVALNLNCSKGTDRSGNLPNPWNVWKGSANGLEGQEGVQSSFVCSWKKKRTTPRKRLALCIEAKRSIIGSHRE